MCVRVCACVYLCFGDFRQCGVCPSDGRAELCVPGVCGCQRSSVDCMLVDLAVVACPLFPLFRVVFFIRHLVHVVVPFHLFVAAATMMRRPWRMTAPANAAPSFPRAAWARGCLTPCGQPSPTRTPRLSERWTAGRPPAQALGPCAMDGTVCWFAGRCHPLPAPTPARCVWDWVCVGGGGGGARLGRNPKQSSEHTPQGRLLIPKSTRAQIPTRIHTRTQIHRPLLHDTRV